MKDRTSLDHLLEAGEPVETLPESPSLTKSIQTLLDFARQRDMLHTEAAWRLSRDVERELEHEAGFQPPGGWARLAALLAGTPYLKAERNGFVPGKVPAAGASSEPELQRQGQCKVTRRARQFAAVAGEWMGDEPSGSVATNSSK